MSWGASPAVPAHERPGGPLKPRVDPAAQQQRASVPKVPRAPRAPAKPNSNGTLSREANRQPQDLSLQSSSLNSSARSSTPTRRSEGRRPRDSSPFNYARVSSLTRERDSIENQVMPCGPARRCSSLGPVGAEHNRRGHVLGHERDSNAGMPWQDPALANEDRETSKGNVARKNTIQNERRCADQDLEWAPKKAGDSEQLVANLGAYRGRVDMLKREAKGEEQTLELHPAMQAATKHAGGATDQPKGRRNVLLREKAGDESLEGPRGQGHGDDVPSYGRKCVLSKEALLGREIPTH